jgi:hypothetical protein
MPWSARILLPKGRYQVQIFDPINGILIEEKNHRIKQNALLLDGPSGMYEGVIIIRKR